MRLSTATAPVQINWAILPILALSLIVFVGVLSQIYPVGVDWEESYHAAFRHFRDPYTHSDFAGIPWLLALPHALLPLEVGNAINFILHILLLGAIIWKYRGGWQAVLLTFTSPLFLDLARTNNVDWVPALAFLLPPEWGLVLLAAKPQTLGCAALIWWKRQKYSLRMLVPLIVVVALSFAIWGWWPGKIGMAEGDDIRQAAWNFAPWPFAIPLGLYLLVQAYKADDEIMAAAATPFLVPYFAPYSLVPLLALLSSRHRKAALYLYFAFWFFFIVEGRRVGMLA